MPGNETNYKSPRTFLPSFWKKDNIVSGQTIGEAIPIVGLSWAEEMPLVRNASLVSIGIMISQVVIAGFIRFELTKNGEDTGKTLDINSDFGLMGFWEFEPGKFIGEKGDKIGFKWGSNNALEPSGVIDVAIFAEIQPK